MGRSHSIKKISVLILQLFKEWERNLWRFLRWFRRGGERGIRVPLMRGLPGSFGKTDFYTHLFPRFATCCIIVMNILPRGAKFPSFIGCYSDMYLVSGYRAIVLEWLIFKFAGHIAWLVDMVCVISLDLRVCSVVQLTILGFFVVHDEECLVSVQRNLWNDVRNVKLFMLYLGQWWWMPRFDGFLFHINDFYAVQGVWAPF